MKIHQFQQGKHLVEVPCNTCDATYSLHQVASSVAQKFDWLDYHILDMNEDLIEIQQAWNITQVPALVLINEGEIIGKVAGYQPEEILEIYVAAKFKEEKH